MLKNIIILNTAYLKFSNSKIFYINKKDDIYDIILFNKDGNIIFEKSFDHNNGIIYSFNEYIFLINKDNDCFQFDTINHLLEKIIDSKNLKFIHSNFNFFIYSDKYSFEKSNQIESPAVKYIYELDKLIWIYEGFGTINVFSKNYALCFTESDPIFDNRSMNSFFLLDLNNKTELWYFNLENHIDKLISQSPFNHPHKVGKPLGIYQDQLWFEMDNYGLMCLNKNTGEFMHYFRDCPENDKRYGGMPRGNYPVIPYTDQAVLLEDEGKIVCLAYWYYWELDLNTMQLDFHYLRDYFQEVGCYTFGARFKPLIIEGNLIYIVSTQTKRFAAFNRNTLKYDWIEQLPDDAGQPKSIEKHEDRIYIETFGRKLLVYEV